MKNASNEQTSGTPCLVHSLFRTIAHLLCEPLAFLGALLHKPQQRADLLVIQLAGVPLPANDPTDLPETIDAWA